MTKQDFMTLSEFRYQLRCFERFTETAVSAEGITPLQYLLLLHIKGYRNREWATIGELAERLQAKPNGVVALVSRCEENGLVERRSSESDRRQVEVHLLANGEAILRRLAEKHRQQLISLADTFSVPKMR